MRIRPPRGAVPAPNQNIENNPMQSSMVVAGVDALSDPARHFDTSGWFCG